MLALDPRLAPSCPLPAKSLDTAPNPTAWMGSAGSYEGPGSGPVPRGGDTNSLAKAKKSVAKTTPIEFIRQVQAETRKVTWPTRRETIMTAVMVMIMTSLLGVFFLGVDSGFDAIVRFLLSLAR